MTTSRAPHSGPDDLLPADPLTELHLLRDLFLVEVEHHLANMAQAQSALRQVPDGAPAAEAANALLRCLHTLKGAAGSVGIDAIARSAHETEELCAEIRAGTLAATAGILERIDEGLTTLRALVDGARSTPTDSPEPLPSATARARSENPPADRRRAPDRRRGLERRAAEEPTWRVDAAGWTPSSMVWATW